MPSIFRYWDVFLTDPNTWPILNTGIGNPRPVQNSASSSPDERHAANRDNQHSEERIARIRADALNYREGQGICSKKIIAEILPTQARMCE